MRPNTVIAERQGDLGGEKVQMTFDQNSLAHLMSVLTDLYSDPELAVIREYSTNALDAQKRAGVERPIEVTTPNGLSPFFKVKDYGVGMDATDIKEIYSQYGASTKRDSNDQVGMLGLGCKSALTYTNSFTVVGVKNGIKTMVVVSRSEDGSGIMEILGENPTDEPNGVEITIPVKRYNEFDKKSHDFFRFWEDGTVLLNGSPVEQISGRVVNGNMTVVPGLASDVVVMGNVPYTVDTPYRLNENMYGRNGVVARVNIGDVSFTPSREALHYTAKTRETLARLRDEFKESIKSVMQRDIDAAETPQEATKAYFEWANIFYGNIHRAPAASYKGEELPKYIECKALVYKMTNSRYAVSEYHGFYPGDVMGKTIIHDFKSQKVPSHNREKIRLWAADREIKGREVYLIDGVPDSLKKWVGTDNLYSWENEVRLVKKPRKPVVKREEVLYTVHHAGTCSRQDITKDEFPDDVAMVLASPQDLKSLDYHWFQSFRAVFPDVMIVRIPTTRWEKFNRDFGKTPELRDFLYEASEEAVAQLTEEDRIYMALDWYSRRGVSNMDPEAIEDPELAQFVRVARREADSTAIKTAREVVSLARKISARYASPEAIHYDPFAKYPLLKGLSESPAYDHAVMYVNMIHNAE
jgi:hypothetical protein